VLDEVRVASREHERRKRHELHRQKQCLSSTTLKYSKKGILGCTHCTNNSRRQVVAAKHRFLAIYLKYLGQTFLGISRFLEIYVDSFAQGLMTSRFNIFQADIERLSRLRLSVCIHAVPSIPP
jgi:hypothetical protein